MHCHSSARNEIKDLYLKNVYASAISDSSVVAAPANKTLIRRAGRPCVPRYIHANGHTPHRVFFAIDIAFSVRWAKQKKKREKGTIREFHSANKKKYAANNKNKKKGGGE